MSQLAKGAVYLSSAALMYMLAGYVTNLWLGRRLGPEEYGLYGIISGLMTTANIAQTSGLPQAMSRYIAESKEKAEAILITSIRLQVISTLAIALIVFVIAKPLANLLHDPRLVGYIRLTSLIFPGYGLYAVYVGYYNGLHNFKRQAFINTLYSIMKVISVVILVIFFSLYGVILGFVIAPLIALIFSAKLPKTTVLVSYRKLVIYSLPLIIFAFPSTLQILIDLFFVKAKLPSASAGFYAASQSICMLPYVGLNAFGGVLFPHVSQKLAKGELKTIQRTITKLMRYLLILLAPITLIISATSQNLIHLLYGKAYSPASTSLSILIFGYSFLTLFLTLANILNGAGEGKRSWTFSGIGILVAVAGYLILTKPFGLAGVAFSTTLGAFISLILGMNAVRCRFGFNFPLLTALRIFFASILVYVLALKIHVAILLLIPFYFFLFIIYCSILVLTKEFSLEDRGLLINILPPRR